MNENEVSLVVLEKRLQNTEHALFALWTLLEDNVEPADAEAINNMMGQYFYANSKLGSYFVTMGFGDG